MSSSAVPVIYAETFGVDTTTRPHALPPTKWVTQQNMRHGRGGLTQVPPLTLMGQFNGSLGQKLIALPAGQKNRSLFVLLTGSKAYQLRDDIASSVALAKGDGSSADFVADPNARWRYTIYNGQIYFVNPLNQIWYTDGTKVEMLSNSPQAMFIDNFYDHLVVGRDFFNGEYGNSRVRWCHLYDFNQWTPTPENEADFFDIAGWERPDCPGGLTAMSKLGEQLFCYTASCIAKSRYVGLPKVMQFDLVSQDIGCGYPAMFVSHRNVHFFFDMVEKDFFSFDGAQLRSIGGGILGHLEDNANLSFDARSFRNRAFVVPDQSEIWWCFESGLTQGIVVYNFRLNEWHTMNYFPSSMADHLAGKGLVRARTCDELPGTADALLGTADNLDTSLGGSGEANPMPTMWLSDDGSGPTVFRDVTSLDADGVINIPASLPTLITGDKHYGKPHEYKEFNAITIQAKQTTTAAAEVGVKVYLCARANLDEPVVFDLLGTWRSDLPEGRLTFAKRAGRFFRWKFEFYAVTPIRGAEWQFFVEHVYGATADK